MLQPAEKRLAIGPHVVYETIRRQGDEEFARTASGLAWLGFGGRSVDGFFLPRRRVANVAIVGRRVASTGLEAGYCVGVQIVILGRQQLFTENTLTVILPFWILAGRAIFAGWLVALMVWLLPGAELAKVSIIITYLVGLAGFDHIIAG